MNSKNPIVQNKQLPLRINSILWEELKLTAAHMEKAPSLLARELIELGCEALKNSGYPRLISIDMVAKPKAKAILKFK